MPKSSTNRVILVTGLSGAGRTTCLKILEDNGFEAVDNLPLSLLPALLAPFSMNTKETTIKKSVAIGIDIRTRDFDPAGLIKTLDLLKRDSLFISIVFLECDSDVLIRRFTETRRRHPLAVDRPVSDGIRIERNLLTQIRQRADVIIDSSNLSLPDFRITITAGLKIESSRTLTITINSFAYRNGIPRESDMIFDVRFLSNPHYCKDLRKLDGRDKRISEFIGKDAFYNDFFKGLTEFVNPLIPRFINEGKSYLTIGVGCTGGRHRSVFVAERLAQWLDNKGHSVTVRHRDL